MIKPYDFFFQWTKQLPTRTLNRHSELVSLRIQAQYHKCYACFSFCLFFSTFNKSYNYPIEWRKSMQYKIDVKQFTPSSCLKLCQKYLKHFKKKRCSGKAFWQRREKKGFASWVRHWKITNVIWTTRFIFFSFFAVICTHTHWSHWLDITIK